MMEIDAGDLRKEIRVLRSVIFVSFGVKAVEISVRIGVSRKHDFRAKGFSDQSNIEILFLYLLKRGVCVFLRLIRGLQLWGIQFFFFLFLWISHREQVLLVQGHQMRDLPLILRNRSSGGLPSPLRVELLPPSPHLSRSIYKLFPRGEYKLQDEYVLDSRIHSHPDPPWNFLNLQKQ
ncbi:uncharacterized protein LOC111436466 [Cucurbita moschata]|uniref:Uncharacterized protein LOC111436466 n=1 Tax=Cucurbita moschata TaxID=3662 RepID=A0A6J1EQG3_CUCMO|nr:uncharacterized protein LOC111436466 [Cucurbita moschata]